MRGSANWTKLEEIFLAHWAFLAFLVVISAAYFELHSISLENFDAGSFAIYVRDGDIYPRLYIPYAIFLILGRQLYEATHADPIVILTSLSSVGAIVVLICQYATTISLVKDKRIALLAFFLLAFSNQFWLTAEEAFSDMFALSLTSVAICLAVVGWRRQDLRLLFLSYVAFGISVGGRLTQVMFLGIPVLLQWRIRQKHAWILFPLGVSIGIAAWLVPTWFYYPAIFNSFLSFFPSAGRPLGVLDIGSIFTGPSSISSLLYRVWDWGIVRNYLLYNFGAWFHPEIPAYRAMATLTFIVTLTVFAAVRYGRRVSLLKLLCAVWIVPYFLLSVLGVELIHPPSLILQILPPICMILAISLSGLSKFIASRASTERKHANVLIRTLLPGMLILLLFTFTFSNVLILHSQRQGVDAIAFYIESNYSPSQVHVIYSWEWSRLAYYIPQYIEYDLFVVDPANQPKILQALADHSKLILITGQAMDIVKQMAVSEGFILRYYEVFSYSRSDLVHALDGTGILYVVSYFGKA